MRLKIAREYLSILSFADDIVFLSNSGKKIERLINDLHRESLIVDLKMNRKTKVVYYDHGFGRQVMIENEALGIMEEYTYL